MYYFQDDLLQNEIEKFYSEIRLKLFQANHENEIFDMFGAMMKKHFPSLIIFMQKLKLSMFERIQAKKTVLDTQLNFVRFHLNGGLLNEAVMLNILEDLHRKKNQEKALKLLSLVCLSLYFCHAQ